METPARDYQRTSFRAPETLLRGVDAWVHGWQGRFKRSRGLQQALHSEAQAVERLAAEYEALDQHALQQRIFEFREAFHREGEIVVTQLPAALAAVREAAHRTLNLRPFPVQLMGALALTRGYLAEMATGEGKTLTAGLAAALFGWTRRPCHIITVNDYLVERDAQWLEPFYHFCGVRVGHVTGPMDTVARAHAYGCDVTYVTAKELLADFLRDRLSLGPWTHPTRRLIHRMLQPVAAAQAASKIVLRGLHTAIVDEADSVLIDEAVTPLIIAAPRKNEALREAAASAQALAGEFEPDDYRVDARHREIELTAAGARKLIEQSRRLPGIWQGPNRRLELLIQALAAREFFQRDRHYIVEDSKLVIVDEFTGRPMQQRTWREGMHQAIEAKEGLPLSDPSETVARLSFQRFFRCFYRLAGMSGTAREASDELWQTYGLLVVSIPPNRPCIREQWPDRLFPAADLKWRAVVLEIERIHRTQRPVLVGTRTVAASETLARMLTEVGLHAQILNATRLREEAGIVALAGEPGRITIATNMAGRGTDIRLGPGVAELGGLHVIATERHESGRVDRQLFGRSARQGDPGSAQAFISLEDELIHRHLPRAAGRVLKKSAALGMGHKPVGQKFTRLAQARAQKLARKQRAQVMRADLWLDHALSFAGGSGIDGV